MCVLNYTLFHPETRDFFTPKELLETEVYVSYSCPPVPRFELNLFNLFGLRRVHLKCVDNSNNITQMIFLG